jgi:hypothetical protein
MTKVSTVSTVSATGVTVEVDGKTQTIPWTLAQIVQRLVA